MEHRVLMFVAADNDARVAERVLRPAGIEATTCTSGAELSHEMAAGVGALLISEECLSDGVQAALEHYVAQQPAWSDLPVLVMARRGADSLQAQRALERLGNVTMLERPVRVITLISAARSALRARERQYETRALNRRKDEFLATLAHELRNPLAPIRNAMAIMQRRHPTDGVHSLTEVVNRQVNHLTRLVDDLLDVARITSGKFELQLSRTTARQVTTHAIEIAQASLQAKGHQVTVEHPQYELALHADHVRLVQTLANLLVNAAKFTPPSGHVQLLVRAMGPEVEFVVRDNGRGLAPGELGRIFEMFEQARGIGEPTGGLGVGLHLARAFAQMHGGDVTAHSQGPGAGSEFIVRLPMVVHDAEAAGQAAPAEAMLQASGWRVLVVDDNADAAHTLADLLGMAGMTTSVAHDGAAAVAKVGDEQPDLVLMDVGMPVMNGYEAARQIRSSGHLRQPLLIALTGWGQAADKTLAHEAGFDLHLVKPLQIDQLLGAIARLRCDSAGS